MCNIGNLLLAAGLFAGVKELVRVAAIWTLPGVVVWFCYVVPTWGALLTGSFSYPELFGVVSSTLAHLGGFAVAIALLREIGMDRRAWLYAFMWYFIVQFISRVVTPAELNVNVAYRVQPGWEQTFRSYWRFWFVLTTLVGLCLWLVGHVLQRIWPDGSVAAAAPRAPAASDV
jgi:hypothetical protein